MLRGGVALIVAVLLVGGGAGVSLAQYGGKPEASTSSVRPPRRVVTSKSLPRR